MAKVFLGLGSNLGNRRNNLKKAIKEIARLPKTSIEKISRFYETKPEGNTPQRKFINAVARICTELLPEKLLRELQKIERKMKRVKTIKWGPRIIDLDILTYDNIFLDKPRLKIPHPLMPERYFVLKPLTDIAPLEKHPLLKKAYKELLQKLKVK